MNDPMLAGGIGHHVSEEETELLPELKASLDREQWMTLGERIAAAKAAAGAPPATAAKRRSAKRTTSRRRAAPSNAASR